MDTGATSHLMNNSSINLSIVNWRNLNSQIMVGDSSNIPVKGSVTYYLNSSSCSRTLKNIVYAPKIINNLVSVRQFITDSSDSVEFDPFGFSVKDLQTGRILTRCNSVGHLYPIFSAPSSSSSSAFAALSSEVWHNRLGHPGDQVLSFLRSNNLIQCNNNTTLSICHGCQLDKHYRLPFSISTTKTYAPFDIIHTDLYTYPLNSHTSFRYYLLFLENYLHYLWVFPLKRKSDFLPTFVRFHAYVKTQFGISIKSLHCDNDREYDIIW